MEFTETRHGRAAYDAAGDGDLVIWSRTAAAMRSVDAGRRLTRTGHVSYLTDPGAVAAALIPFADAAFGHENTTDAVLAAPHPGGRPAAAPHQAG